MNPTLIDSYVDDVIMDIETDMIEEKHTFTIKQQERLREFLTDLLLENAD